jgi:outer membrane receptor for ferrienterochelin and colicin
MTNWKKLASGVAFVAVSAALAPAYAQVTSSGVTGSVSNADGTPAADATVTVVDTRTGLTRSVVSTPTGAFDVRGLNVGGPYTVSVSKAGEQPTQVTDVFLNLGAPTDINLAFSGATTADVIVITATQAGAAPIALGPAAVYSLEALESQPASNRDIKDIIRQDPRISLDYASGGTEGSNGIQCAGQHPRFSSLTVDGVRLSDDFGLNSNGYPTERIPFSYDSISQVSVELAPFDVQYGGFTACNINAVTKSGSNEFHGSAFADYTDDSLYGDSTDGIARNLGSFEEKRYGFSLGGPIIPDTLFFFTAYEKLEGANIFGKVPGDVGITQAQYDAVINTAVNQYGYVAGGLPTSKPVEDEKFFAKIDWNINDRHRAAFTYTYNDGFNYSPSDNGATQISDFNHYYERGAKAEAYTASLYSDWTDDFSTEIRVSYLDLANRQISVNGVDFGEIQVTVPQVGTGTTTIYLGADDSRHSNVLSYNTLNYKLAGHYRVDDHQFSGGYERQELDVFNLFLAETQGEWRFASAADFAAGNLSYFEYSNSVGTNNPNDSAAEFSYGLNTLFLQDEWAITDRLNLVGGLRLEWYDSSDRPAFNQPFMNRYGFRNDETFDGAKLLQPRFGFTYDATDDIVVRGGIGLFSGGNPNVWLSNSYSNDGVSAADFICQSAASNAPTVSRCNFPGVTFVAPFNPLAPNLNDFTYPGSGRPFYEVPQQGINYIAGANAAGSVNAVDPDFELPSQWKLALGTTVNFETDLPFIGHDWTLNADALLAQANESAVVLPLGYTTTRRALDGRPVYTGNTNDFVLTNSVKKPYSQVYSLSLNNSYGNGIDWTLGYAYTNARDTNPMTSSVAFSNFTNYATRDPVNIPLATSDYENTHRITFNFNWELAWAENWETKISLFGAATEGAPYSYNIGNFTAATGVFGNTSALEPFSGTRQLAYIPNGVTDPAIAPTSNAAAVAALVAFIDNHDVLSDHKGGIAPRNVARDDWYTKFDLKLSQNFPGVMGTDSFEGFVMIENLGNLLNDGWGVQREHSFFGTPLYGISSVDAQGRYVITGFNANVDRDSIIVGASLWNVRMGVKYEF